MRLQGRYADPDNSIAALKVTLRADDEWQPLQLGIDSPGFLIFVYSVFTCQHTHFRITCAEQGLTLDTAEGEIELATSEAWNIKSIHLSFSGNLKSGTASPDDIEKIVKQMQQCPVSRNLVSSIETTTKVTLEP